MSGVSVCVLPMITSLLCSQRGQPTHFQFKEPPLKDGEMERRRWRERQRGRGQQTEDERKKRKEGGRERERVDAVMRSVAMATSGAGLCWALIYIVPHERWRESKWEMEEKRERDGES